MKSGQDKTQKPGEMAAGLVLVCLCAGAAWWYFGGHGDKPLSQDPRMTLGQFKALSAQQRSAYVAGAIEDYPGAANDAEAFGRCMGDFAWSKSGTLLFTEVLGWCEAERLNNRALFDGHFDELADGDLSINAIVVCEMEMKDRLVAPASADFAGSFAKVRRLPRQAYQVNDYVDSQNVFGATLRTRFTCNITFKGGDKYSPTSWTAPEITITQ